jgi:hypothetical protein
VPYTPECGLREIRATATLALAATHRVSAMLTGTGTRLEGGAAKSRLTRERNSWEAGLEFLASLERLTSGRFEASFQRFACLWLRLVTAYQGVAH